MGQPGAGKGEKEVGPSGASETGKVTSSSGGFTPGEWVKHGCARQTLRIHAVIRPGLPL